MKLKILFILGTAGLCQFAAGDATVHSDIPRNVLSTVLGPELPKAISNGNADNADEGNADEGNADEGNADEGNADQEVVSNPPVMSAGVSRALPSSFDYNNRHKPSIHSAFKPHLFQFVKNAEAESCDALADELSNNEATTQASYYFLVAISMFNKAYLSTPQERVNVDKNAANAFNLVTHEMVKDSGQNSGGDLVTYMKRIITCHVEPLEDRRTILMRLLEKGMEKSLKTTFVESLVFGTNDYDPSMTTDAYGNTLMHLAVQSGAWNLPSALISIENKRNVGDATRSMNTIYWVISALDQENDDHKKPLQLNVATNVKHQLKKFFRAYTLLLKIKAIRAGIKLDPDMFTEMDAQLQSVTPMSRM